MKVIKVKKDEDRLIEEVLQVEEDTMLVLYLEEQHKINISNMPKGFHYYAVYDNESFDDETVQDYLTGVKEEE